MRLNAFFAHVISRKTQVKKALHYVVCTTCSFASTSFLTRSRPANVGHGPIAAWNKTARVTCDFTKAAPCFWISPPQFGQASGRALPYRAWNNAVWFPIF